ncbi:hypothetical protein ACS0TY_009312 [Phlomoides rotata]
MARAALVSLAHILLEEILDVVQQCIFSEPRRFIKSLHRNTISLLSFLDDFPGEAGDYEARIAIVADKAHDIIRYNISGKRIPLRYESFNVSNRFQQAVHRVILSIRIRTLHLELDKYYREIGDFCNEVSLIKSKIDKNMMSISGSKPSSNIKEDIIVGFEEDLMEIKGRLFGEPSKLQITPIVGMGGIGKTTLAAYVHDDPLSVYHFDVRAFVTVSQKYNEWGILSEILCLIDASKQHQGKNDEELKTQIYQSLKGRRYLIVMDDIWSTNVWDDVQRIFPDDSNGSRIIITTRELDIALYVAPLRHHHEMHLISVDQSWNLLKKKVFAEEHCPPEFEEIGMLIARNCGGLPLAIVVIAGVLAKVNRMQETWINIAENVKETVNASDGRYSEILSLSYAHLPHHLRPCFLYIGGFPGSYEINASKLIRLWAAEGFLTSDESKDMEELGDEYLEDLAKRSLVLIDKKRYNGKIRAVKMHDLLRDLCLNRARDEKFLHVINEFLGSFPEGIEKSQRVSVFSKVWGSFPDMDGSTIHTILLFNHWSFDSWKSFRLLRVVDAMSFCFQSYSDLGYLIELFHLRYLAFTTECTQKTLIFGVSETFYQLQNLETLIIKVFNVASHHGSCTYPVCLAFNIWGNPKLRHLILLDGFLHCHFSKYCPEDASALENLHTLSRIKGFACSQRILKTMQNLKKLGIFYSYEDLYESGWSKYSLNNLVHLCKLEKLSIYAEPYPNLKNDVSQNLGFPATLIRLSLSGCRFPWEDMRTVGSLPNLQVLKLKRHACCGTEWETIEGEFDQLRVLLIDTTDLHHWATESCPFPRLERLTLYDCQNLREIPCGIGEIPTLQLIEVDIQNSSVVESAESLKEEQESFGNDLQVRRLKSRSWRR